MPAKLRDALEGEFLNAKASLRLLESRYRYMCRNNGTDYTIRDLILASFAIEVARRLLDHVKQRIDDYDIKKKITDYFDVKRHLALLERDCKTFHDGMSMKEFSLVEEDQRDVVTMTEDMERKLILYDRKIVDSASPKKPRVFLFVLSAERAGREDIVNGESEDYRVLVSAFTEVLQSL